MDIKTTMRLPTRLDRYPAKMTTRLADKLISKYAKKSKSILDPFCGSGAILLAAKRNLIPTTGIDINPISALLTHVKMKGFSSKEALKLLNQIFKIAKSKKILLPVNWNSKNYWFTKETLNKYEYLRSAMSKLKLYKHDEGKAILLSYSLSVRLCSRADQQSPKPFISARAIKSRSGRHYNPYKVIKNIFQDLSRLYADKKVSTSSKFYLFDIANNNNISKKVGIHSHVITSPPYINAQDYFRNFKLELYFLNGLYPFSMEYIKEHFIGTEKGDLAKNIPDEIKSFTRGKIRGFKKLEQRNIRLANVVNRYFCDMSSAFNNMKKYLKRNGMLILVCGDNLVGGLRIKTNYILRRMLEEKGFQLVDSFSDTIVNRSLAPTRMGHKGLIKKEIVNAFVKI